MTSRNKKIPFRRFLTTILLPLVFLFSFVISFPQSASAQPVNPNAAPTQQQGQPPEDTETTCAVEKIGWIVCPVVEGAAKLGDNLFKFLADNFLQTEPELLSNEEGNGTVTAWEIARNLANVMFIIAFLIIIYSQVTGAGISNYGLKRMLPRLIIAAIAVNVSYYICQGMVDISNILGYEIKKALTDIATGPNGVSDQHVLASTSSQGTNTQTSDGTLAVLAMAILAAAAVWIFLGFLGPIIGLVVITCIVIIIILLLRKALIVLLVVASPIAFVMYLLPNTEKYFSKWLNMFWQLLMVFPIVALLFGGGQLASAIILTAGMKGSDSYKVEGEGCVNLKQIETNQQSASSSGANGTGGTQQASASANDTQCTSDGPGWMLALVAAGIAVAPLLAVWSVLKGALAAAGAIGGKIAGAVQKGAGSGVGFVGGKVGKGKDAAKKYAGESARAAWQRSQARGLSGEGGKLDTLAGNYARRRARRAVRLSSSKEDFERQQAAYMNDAGVLTGASSGLTEQGQRRAQSRAAAAEIKEQREQIDAATARLEIETGGDFNQLETALESAVKHGDTAGAIAAQKMFMEAGEGGANKFKEIISRLDAQNLGNSTAIQGMRRNITTQQSEVKGKSADIYNWASHTPTTGEGYRGINSEENFDLKGLTDAQVASQRSSVLSGAIQTGQLSGQRAYKIATNDTVMANAKGAQAELIRELARTRPQPPAQG